MYTVLTKLCKYNLCLLL